MAIQKNFDVVIVGAGFAGLYMLHKLREYDLTAVIVEAADDVGGTWYWNRYPGSRCDVESLVYSYSFSPELQREWRWTERFSTAEEIYQYLRFVAERLDLRRDILFATRVERSVFDARAGTWTVATDQGDAITARLCVMATGPLSAPTLPDIPGIGDFAGRTFQAAKWTEKASFVGERVGVIGTGSSGTQIIPTVAKEADQLSVFLRTPNFVVPARNGVLSDAQYAEWRAKCHQIWAREASGEILGAGDVFLAEDLRRTFERKACDFTPAEQRANLERRWEFGGALMYYSFADTMTDEAANAIVAEFVRDKIRTLVADPGTARKLTPEGYLLGSRRLCVGTEFYETFNRDNVELIDVNEERIERVTASGIRTNRRDIELDSLIFATGFDALTGALTRIDIIGRDGKSLKDTWADGSVNYLGIAINGFPNLFMIGGPGSPSALSNVVISNEHHVEYLARLFDHMRQRHVKTFEATAEAQRDWVAHNNECASQTLFGRGDNWYVGANVPGKPRMVLPYVGGLVRYRAKCADVEARGYDGFVLA